MGIIRAFRSVMRSLFRSPGHGIIRDVKGRLPYYWSDWKDAWNYRVIPSTVYMYFTNLLPAIAFAQDMFDRTANSYGVNEVLLASAMGGIVFGLFAGQPLCIVGVTGPISIFNYTVYQIVHPKGIPYFPFMAWICLWAMVMHFIIAIFNWVNILRYCTRFSCDIFGWFICWIYVQKGIEILIRQFSVEANGGGSSLLFTGNGSVGIEQGYLSCVIALATVIFGIMANLIGTRTKLFYFNVRKFLADYGTPLAVVFFTGFIHFGNRLQSADIQRLPITSSFVPTDTSSNRPHGWFIHFWEIGVGDIFLALPFAFLLTTLFYFDHNISSLICQGSEFPLKKAASFHWDFFLLGITTGIAGILGIPAPNGLIPQAPLHTISLCVLKTRDVDRGSNSEEEEEEVYREKETYVDSVIEQRLSNFGQGLLILGTMSGPLLTVLGLVPQAVLAGLFWIMGFVGLMNNTITDRICFIFTDKSHIDPSKVDWSRVSKRNLYLFTIIELIGFAAEFGITQTIAAVGFPGVLLGFSGVGYLIPKFIPEPDMSILDQPTGSEFIFKNLRIDDEKSIAEDEENNRKEVSLGQQQTEV